MRNLTEKENSDIKNDVEILLDFCLKNGLVNNLFEEKLKGINFRIGDFKNRPNAKARAEHSTKKIEVDEDVFESDYFRRRIIYHEIGHLLYDFNLNRLCEGALRIKLLDITKKNNLKDANPLLAIAGFKLLQEYIVEKFSVLVASDSLNKKIEVNPNSVGKFSGCYTFSSTFGNSYGLYESICDELINKTYPNIIDMFKDCLNSNFYINLLNNYEEESIFRFMEKMGDFYNKSLAYTEKNIIPNENEVKEKIEYLKELVKNIKVTNVVKKEDNFSYNVK